MITDLDVIVKEWAYRVNDGKPNPNNSTHLYHLSEILIEYKWPYQVIDEIIQNLVEQETKFKGRTKDGKLRYFKTKDSLDKALEKGAVEPVGEPDKKDDEPQQDPTKLSGPKDFERPSDDTPKQEPKKKSIKAPSEKETASQRKKRRDENNRIVDELIKEAGGDMKVVKKIINKRRDQLLQLQDVPAGGGGSLLGEKAGGDAVVDVARNPGITEKQFVDKQMKELRGTPLYDKMVLEAKSKGSPYDKDPERLVRSIF